MHYLLQLEIVNEKFNPKKILKMPNIFCTVFITIGKKHKQPEFHKKRHVNKLTISSTMSRKTLPIWLF